MDILKSVEGAQITLLDKVGKAAKRQDSGDVVRLGALVQQCEGIAVEARVLEQRLRAIVASLNGSSGHASAEPPTYAPPTAERATKSAARRSASFARSDWVRGLAAQGIVLTGHAKRYLSSSGKSVGVAFANELTGLANKWFLGLTDEPTDVAVLLCRATSGKVYDLVLPVTELRTAWRALSRSGGQIKFNVRKDASRLLLVVTGAEPVDVTRNCGVYDPLR